MDCTALRRGLRTVDDRNSHIIHARVVEAAVKRWSVALVGQMLLTGGGAAGFLLALFLDRPNTTLPIVLWMDVASIVILQSVLVAQVMPIARYNAEVSKRWQRAGTYDAYQRFYSSPVAFTVCGVTLSPRLFKGCIGSAFGSTVVTVLKLLCRIQD